MPDDQNRRPTGMFLPGNRRMARLVVSFRDTLCGIAPRNETVLSEGSGGVPTIGALEVQLEELVAALPASVDNRASKQRTWESRLRP